jgi:hypothetical protein
MKDQKKVEAGRALASQVSRDYYRFIGRKGGRKYMYNMLMRLAQEWTPSADQIDASASPVHLARFIADMRQMYFDQAQDYKEFTGQAIMLDLFRPENDIKKTRKRTNN